MKLNELLKSLQCIEDELDNADKNVQKNLVFVACLLSYLKRHSIFNFDDSKKAIKMIDSNFQITLTKIFLAGANLNLLDGVVESIGNKVELKDVHVLGSVFEHYLSSNISNKEGVFYTPPAIVREIVDQALSTVSKSKNSEFTILDPACGSGAFLFEALSHLSADYTPKQAAAKLYGLDKDARAVAVTKFCLMTKLYSKKVVNLNDNIKVGNFLLDPRDFNLLGEEELIKKFQAFSFKDEFSKVSHFDLIIGNPPYGLSRDQQLDPQENNKLKEIYSGSRSGKINKYISFMAKSYSLLSKQGVLSFVVPNAWLGIRGGREIRRKFLEDGALRSVKVFETPIFKNAGVECIIFEVNKKKRSEEILIERRAGLKGGNSNCTFKIPVKYALMNSDYIIPTMWCEGAETVLEKLDQRSFRLGSSDSPFISAIALQAYAVGKGFPPQTQADVKNHVFHSRSKLDASSYAYLEGADISRFGVKWSGKYLRYGEWLAEAQQISRFLGPRLIIREIINPAPYILNAAFVDSPFLYNKSVLHILPKAADLVIQLWALLGILNSKLGSFVIRYRGRKSQRSLFPKIVNEDLLNFPISVDLPKFGARLAQNAMNCAENYSSTNLDRLNETVFASYQFDDKLQQVVHHGLL